MSEAPETEGEEDTRQHELVIIRRRGGEDEAPHKGGVWKIAHADFMTALMAFFLVMWLISATDEKTISGVANYFNPMRLSDSETKPKGLFTMEPGDGDEGDKATKEQPKEKKSGGKEDQPRSSDEGTEAELFSNPYQALDKIAAEVGNEQTARSADKGAVPSPRGGDAFRDPFDPDFQRGPMPKGRVGGDVVKVDEGQVADSGGSGTEDARPDDEAEKELERRRQRVILKQEIEKAVADAGLKALPGIEVSTTREGLLISITDQYDFEMFGIASAHPRAELVVLMDKLGNVIANRPEQLIIRGHTDGRPFRSDNYDNWRLSTARAHMANYMLMRGGLPADRVDRIEGHADRHLKVAGDPLDASNRRIEILLEEKPEEKKP